MHDTDLYQRPVAAFLFAVTDPISSLGPDVPERLGKLLELVKIVGELEAAGVGFESTTERIETSTAAGRLVFHVFAALAEFERRLIVERTVAGLAAARARGRKGGRPGLPAEKVAAIQALAASGRGPAEVCKALGIGRSTFYKHTRDAQSKSPPVAGLGDSGELAGS